MPKHKHNKQNGEKMEKQKINMKMECNHFEMSFHSRAAQESDIAATNSKLLIAVVICSYLRFTKTDPDA